jgi:hypothetical protein
MESINWDDFAEALKNKFGDGFIDERFGIDNPYNYHLEYITVQKIVDFVKEYTNQ